MYVVGDTVTEAQVDLPALDDILIVPFATFLESGIVGADGEPESLSTWLEDHNFKEPRVASCKPSVVAPPEGAVMDVLVSFPWAEEYDDRPWSCAADAQEATGSRDAAAGAISKSVDLSERKIEEAWEALAAKRRDMSDSGNRVSCDFICFVRGGAWTAAHKGTAADYIVAQARGTAVAWCSKFQLVRRVSGKHLSC